MTEVKYQGDWALSEILSLQQNIARVQQDIEYQQSKLDALMQDLKATLDHLEAYEEPDFDWTILGPIRTMLLRLEPPPN